MGRKGGGRAAFMRAARRGPMDDDPIDQQDAAPVPKTTSADVATPEAGQGVKNASDKSSSDPYSFGTKASAFLLHPPEPSTSKEDDGQGNEKEKRGINKENNGDDVEDGDDMTRSSAKESRGQMIQRHKREAKAMKEHVKRLGKKGKEEAARLEAELKRRHATEIDQFEIEEKKRESTIGQGEATETGEASDPFVQTLKGMSISTEDREGRKLTKAQRKKQQKAMKEAEREARIAAEIAELGETERLAEERELKQVLEPLGLAIHEIPPDGHCLYRSLEDQLRRARSDNGPTEEMHGVDGEKKMSNAYQELRKQAAEYLRKHESEFRPFVVVDEETSASTLAEDDEATDDKIDPYEAYCRELESTAAWGGQIEIQALSKALGVHIEVFSVGLPVVQVGEEFKGAGSTLRLCYLRHAYGLGEHFNSVIPA